MIASWIFGVQRRLTANFSHWLFSFLIAPLGVGALTFLFSTASIATAQPDWFSTPPDDDADFIYQEAYAAKHKDRHSAIDAAYRIALQRLANRISVTVRASAEDRVRETQRSEHGKKDSHLEESFFESGIQTLATHQLIGTDIVQEEASKNWGKWEAWVVVSYPMVQYRKALDRIPDLMADLQRMEDDARGPDGKRDTRLPLLVCPLAFGPESEEQFPELVANFRQKGYGNAIWQTVEDKLYDSGRFLFVTPPQKQMRSMLEQILGRAPDTNEQKLPRRFLLCNMNFFEIKSESLFAGRTAKRTEYHAELMLEYYNLDGPYTNIKIPAKGESRARDLPTATGEAAANAIRKLLLRIDKEEG